MTSKQETANNIVRDYGRTFAEELGADVQKNTPSPLFRLLCFSLLASARISHEIAMQAAKALAEEGWTTPKHMQDSTWRQRTDVLNHSGYARYDESTSRMLADTVELLMEEYGGDLRKLREAAGGDLGELRRRLKECKGIGDTGADLFLREVQIAWDEVYPFVDDKAAVEAERSGLPKTAKALARYADGRKAYVRLVDGLLRKSYDH